MSEETTAPRVAPQSPVSPRRKVQVCGVDGDVYVRLVDLIVVAAQEGDLTAVQLDRLLTDTSGRLAAD